MVYFLQVVIIKIPPSRFPVSFLMQLIITNLVVPKDQPCGILCYLRYRVHIAVFSTTHNLQQTTFSNFAAFAAFSKITNKACYFKGIL